MLMIGLLLVSPFLFQLIVRPSAPGAEKYSAELAALDSLQVIIPSAQTHYEPGYKTSDRSASYTSANSYTAHETKAQLFKFDPNSIDVAGWQKLGVKEKTANSIQKYLSKGGKFREPSDIKKVWGISPELQQKLLPYVDIAPVAQQPYYKAKYFPAAAYVKNDYQKRIVDAIDINEADTSAYIALPAIGSKLAGRIVNFRERLGGFYAIAQVSETFGLPDSSYQKIKPFLRLNSRTLRQMNINTVSEEQLRQHPYVRWQLAKVIIEYRKQHGSFASVADLRKIMIITEEIFKRIEPYLKLAGN